MKQVRLIGKALELQTVDVAMEEDGGWKIYARESEDWVDNDDEENLDYKTTNPSLTSLQEKTYPK